MYFIFNLVSLEELKKSLDVNKTTLNDVLVQLKNKISEDPELDEEDRSLEFLEGLIKESTEAINITQEKITLLSNHYDELIKYFGDSSKDISFSTFWVIFDNFATDMNVFLLIT